MGFPGVGCLGGLGLGANRAAGWISNHRPGLGFRV